MNSKVQGSSKVHEYTDRQARQIVTAYDALGPSALRSELKEFFIEKWQLKWAPNHLLKDKSLELGGTPMRYRIPIERVSDAIKRETRSGKWK